MEGVTKRGLPGSTGSLGDAIPQNEGLLAGAKTATLSFSVDVLETGALNFQCSASNKTIHELLSEASVEWGGRYISVMELNRSLLLRSLDHAPPPHAQLGGSGSGITPEGEHGARVMHPELKKWLSWLTPFGLKTMQLRNIITPIRQLAKRLNFEEKPAWWLPEIEWAPTASMEKSLAAKHVAWFIKSAFDSVQTGFNMPAIVACLKKLKSEIDGGKGNKQAWPNEAATEPFVKFIAALEVMASSGPRQLAGGGVAPPATTHLAATACGFTTTGGDAAAATKAAAAATGSRRRDEDAWLGRERSRGGDFRLGGRRGRSRRSSSSRSRGRHRGSSRSESPGLNRRNRGSKHGGGGDERERVTARDKESAEEGELLGRQQYVQKETKDREKDKKKDKKEGKEKGSKRRKTRRRSSSRDRNTGNGGSAGAGGSRKRSLSPRVDTAPPSPLRRRKHHRRTSHRSLSSSPARSPAPASQSRLPPDPKLAATTATATTATATTAAAAPAARAAAEQPSPEAALSAPSPASTQPNDISRRDAAPPLPQGSMLPQPSLPPLGPHACADTTSTADTVGTAGTIGTASTVGTARTAGKVGTPELAVNRRVRVAAGEPVVSPVVATPVAMVRGREVKQLLQQQQQQQHGEPQREKQEEQQQQGEQQQQEEQQQEQQQKPQSPRAPALRQQPSLPSSPPPPPPPPQQQQLGPLSPPEQQQETRPKSPPPSSWPQLRLSPRLSPLQQQQRAAPQDQQQQLPLSWPPSPPPPPLPPPSNAQEHPPRPAMPAPPTWPQHGEAAGEVGTEAAAAAAACRAAVAAAAASGVRVKAKVVEAGAGPLDVVGGVWDSGSDSGPHQQQQRPPEELREQQRWSPSGGGMQEWEEAGGGSSGGGAGVSCGHGGGGIHLNQGVAQGLSHAPPLGVHIATCTAPPPSAPVAAAANAADIPRAHGAATATATGVRVELEADAGTAAAAAVGSPGVLATAALLPGSASAAAAAAGALEAGVGRADGGGQVQQTGPQLAGCVAGDAPAAAAAAEAAAAAGSSESAVAASFTARCTAAVADAHAADIKRSTVTMPHDRGAAVRGDAADPPSATDATAVTAWLAVKAAGPAEAAGTMPVLAAPAHEVSVGNNDSSRLTTSIKPDPEAAAAIASLPASEARYAHIFDTQHSPFHGAQLAQLHREYLEPHRTSCEMASSSRSGVVRTTVRAGRWQIAAEKGYKGLWKHLEPLGKQVAAEARAAAATVTAGASVAVGQNSSGNGGGRGRGRGRGSQGAAAAASGITPPCQLLFTETPAAVRLLRVLRVLRLYESRACNQNTDLPYKTLGLILPEYGEELARQRLVEVEAGVEEAAEEVDLTAPEPQVLEVDEGDMEEGEEEMEMEAAGGSGGGGGATQGLGPAAAAAPPKVKEEPMV